MVITRPAVGISTGEVRPHKEVSKPTHSRIPAKIPAKAHAAILCNLSGQAIYQGVPYGHADIDFWVTSARGQEMRHIKTNADGSYQVAFLVDAKADEPLDWELRARTQDLKFLHRTGRQIVRDDESPIAVHNVLKFVAD
jgi:hypothetical protein